MKSKRIVFILTLLCLALVLSSCARGPDREMKASKDWSRGLEISQSVTGSTGMVVEQDGQRLYLVYPVEMNGENHLVYEQMDAAGQQVLKSEIALSGQIRKPRIIQGQAGQLHLFWSKRSAGEKVWSLWHGILKPDGALEQETLRQISNPETNVGDFEAIPDGSGGSLVVVGGIDPQPVYLLHLDAGGRLIAGPKVLSEAGINPSLSLDQDGNLHLTWLEDVRVMYTELALDGLSEEIPPQKVASLRVGMGSSLSGPEIGLSDGWVYVLWSLLYQSGMQAGSASCEYIAFPIAEPELLTASPIWIASDENPAYQPFESPFSITQLSAPPRSVTSTSEFIMEPYAAPTDAGQLAVALVVNQQFRLDQQMQVALAVFEDGLYKGYMMAGKTERVSDEPVLGVDGAGNLYLTWREAAGGRYVYYAATAPSARAELDRVGVGDVVEAFLRGGIESAATVALLPVIGFGWLLPGFILLGIWKLFREYENLSDPISWIPLVIAVLIYEAAKFATLPAISTYVPFSAWIDIPPALDVFLLYGVPIAIFLLGMLAAIYVQRKYTPSTLTFYLSLVLVDALFTLAIYGVNFLGVGVV